MAKENTKEPKKIVHKLRNKYRLVILNDDTFEEKLSLKLSRLNVFLISGFGIVFLIAATTLLIAFTPLREYIPGYSSTELRKQANELTLTTDSLQQQLTFNQRYLLNLKNIISGKPIINFSDTAVADSTITAELNKSISREDSILRNMVEEEERFNLDAGTSESKLPLSGISFFIPVKGLVTNDFDVEQDHYGVDIVARKNEVIKATQDGIVVFNGWTAETGHVLVLQHRQNFLSIYKHNSALLKKEGELVKVGEPIAIIGNSGELSSGPHLHFELWYNGNAVNPRDYIPL
ncbi:MAG: M23 family metallopeptidase [Owenweeksia sp.]